ncbi:hypothetical protein BT69DRAFT_1357062 [Atractiella rhizophila]|nr:hypothetical protein BT69DRAFT_1357062 [Atractiella rhizophila]
MATDDGADDDALFFRNCRPTSSTTTSSETTRMTLMAHEIFTSEPTAETQSLQSLATNKTSRDEPNPFELAFNPSHQSSPSASGVKRSNSTSPNDIHISGIHTPRTPGNNKLPPFSSIETRSIPSELNWSANVDSLRRGPLSPSLLDGPVQQDPSLGLAHSFPFKTGLTPQGSGLTPLLNGSLPPITPNTASAIQHFIMGDSPAPPPISATNLEGNLTDTIAGNSQAPYTSTHTVSDRISSLPASFPVLSTQAESPSLNSAERSVIAAASGSRSQPAALPSHSRIASVSQTTASANLLLPDASRNQNGLFLLTQAHEFTQQPDDIAAAAALSSLNNNSGFGALPVIARPSAAKQPPTVEIESKPSGSQTRGKKVTPTGGSKRKRTETSTSGAGGGRKAKRTKMVDDSEEDEEYMSLGKEKEKDDKPETEEEKRKSFLERNRQAALKCRQRKKAWLASLQAKVEYLSTDNEALQATVVSLQEEITSLRTLLLEHRECLLRSKDAQSRQASTLLGYTQ